MAAGSWRARAALASQLRRVGTRLGPRVGARLGPLRQDARGAGLQQEWRRLAHRQVGDVLELDEGEHDDAACHFPRAHLELVVRLLVLHVVKGQVVWLGLGLESGLGLGLGLTLTLTLTLTVVDEELDRLRRRLAWLGLGLGLGLG